MAVPPVRDASTVLAVREALQPGAGLRIYMVKRNSKMGFLGGRHVFPGGAVDAADSSDAVASLFHGMEPSAASSFLDIEDQARARGFIVAAVRELYEEAGILLAVDDGDQWVDLNEGDRAQRLRDARPGVAAGARDFGTLLTEEGLRIAAGAMETFAHWITPIIEKKRFDTHFFLAPAPPAQSADHDRTESTAGAWMTAGEVLTGYRSREIELVPPTITTLQWLSAFDTVEAAMAGAKAEVPVPIFPKICMEEELVSILYPGDADYEEGKPGPIEGRTTNRLILVDGLWERPA
jgi:8-oxo-dGTP pyrophosphatase MutT (NUDIX family)